MDAHSCLDKTYRILSVKRIRENLYSKAIWKDLKKFMKVKLQVASILIILSFISCQINFVKYQDVSGNAESIVSTGPKYHVSYMSFPLEKTYCDELEGSDIRKAAEKSRDFIVGKNSRASVEMSVKNILFEPTGGNAISLLFMFLTFGLIPSYLSCEWQVNFRIWDRKSSSVVSEFSIEQYENKFTGLVYVDLPFTIIAGLAQRAFGFEPNFSMEETRKKRIAQGIYRKFEEILFEKLREDPKLEQIFQSSEEFEPPTLFVHKRYGHKLYEMVLEITESYLTDSGVQLVERDPKIVKAILDEQIFEQSGLVRNPVRLGQLSGAKMLLSGDLQLYSEEVVLVWRLTSTETGEILGEKAFPQERGEALEFLVKSSLPWLVQTMEKGKWEDY